MDSYTIRRATAQDAAHLRDMLVEAVNGDAVLPRPRLTVLEDPRSTRYIAGWPRPTDFGAIAFDDLGAAIGAAWARVLPPEDAGDGYLAPGVPELTMGVHPLWRARGIGRDLLRAVLDQARSAGHARLSLAVDHANFARRLYVSEGFRTVETRSGFDVMVRRVA
jgi:GNAT superfamily N-acetyltransferase